MKKMPKTYKQSTVNAVILVLVLVLFLYLGAQLTKNFSAMVSTQRTQVITDVDYLHLKGYVFRHETPVSVQGEGVCDYLLEDGAKVGVDQTYAVYYRTEGASEKQSKLDGITRQIRRLSSKSAIGETVSDLSAINEALSSAYYSYINSVQNGNFSTADRQGEALVDALVNYRSLTTGWNDVASGTLAALEDQKKALLSDFGAGEKLVAREGFYFFRDTDGYETVFSPEKLDGISCEELDKLVSSNAQTYSGRVIGKRVNSAEWFLVVPTDAETVMRFSYEILPEVSETETESGSDETQRANGDGEVEPEIGFYTGRTYTVTYSSIGEKSAEMKLDDAYIDENGKGYLVFSSYDLALSAELSRAQDVKVKMSSTTGYRIPTEALTELDGEDGVYILIGTVVEFRRVTVIERGDGYCIVNTYEKDRAELESAEGEGDTATRPPYLYVNDLIITSGNDLYDGKLLD